MNKDKFLNSKSHVILLDGAVGSGKSFLAQEYIHNMLKKNRKDAYLVCRHVNVPLYIERYTQQIIDQYQFDNFKINYQYYGIEYSNRSTIRFIEPSLLQHLSHTDIIFLENADDLLFNHFQMANKIATQVILACNVPMMDDPTQHWIYQKLILNREVDRYNFGAKDIKLDYTNFRNIPRHLYTGYWLE